jgi:flagellar biosynthesis protein FlhF
MNIKRFFGKNSREALGLVKKALGENAIILSNRSVNGGNEIMAFKEEDINALIHEEMDGHHNYSEQSHFNPNEFIATHQTAQNRQFNHDFQRDFLRPDMTKSHQNKVVAEEQAALQLLSQQAKPKHSFDSKSEHAPTITKPIFERIDKPLAESNPVGQQAVRAHAASAQDHSQMAEMLKEMSNMRREIESQLASFKPSELKPLESLPKQAMMHAPKQAQLKSQDNLVQKPAEQYQVDLPAPMIQSPQMMEMLKEMRNMRSAFESKLTSLNWANISHRNPLKAQILSLMLNAGFSASLSRQFAEKLPDAINGKIMTAELAKIWVKSVLALNLNTIEHEQDIFDRGGIFALIGPTGVGKTTTTAKLAARYAMKHGTENLGLITTDGYRVGGYEQLRTYGKILGVMVYAVKDETDLKIALNELKNKHTILIDTVGVSQRDRMVAEQIEMLSNSQRPINKLLCLNATSSGATLTDVVRAYQGKGLAGCILTKTDEAATTGNALDVVIRHKLKLFYETNGQRVPEDIVLSCKKTLIEQAFAENLANQKPYQFLQEELPFVMGSMAQSKPENESGEVGYV